MLGNTQTNPSGKAKLLAIAIALGGFGLQSNAQTLLGQWDFNDGFDPDDEFFIPATVGEALEITTDDIVDGAEIDSTDNFGITANLSGSTMAFKLPKTDDAEGIFVPADIVSDFGGIVDNWTLIMDVYYPEASSGATRSLIELTSTLNGAEFAVGSSNGLLVQGAEDGVIEPNTWTRVAFVVDIERDAPGIDKYIDGVLVGTFNLNDTAVLGQLASLTADALLFADENDNIEETFVSSLQFWEGAVSKGQIEVLAGATAEGLPTELPPEPSFIVGWTPALDIAVVDEDFDVTINPGSTSVSQIAVLLDDAPVGFSEDEEDGLIVVDIDNPGNLELGSEYTLTLNYTDDLDGDKSFSTTFSIALWSEDFEDLDLGAPVDEGLPGDAVWTDETPDGWVLDDSGVPGVDDPETDGVTEWAGWSFADKNWWIAAAGGQRRDEFENGDGAIMIFDGDEWDDAPHADGEMTGFVTTADIDVSSVPAGNAILRFDSSWRPYDDSRGTVAVSFDGGAFENAIVWESQSSSPFFKEDGTFINETVEVPLNNPAASTMQLRFGMEDVGNDWWWAVDNLFIKVDVPAPFITQQPAAAEADEGGDATFSVVATGGQPLSYQWYRLVEEERVAIDGATGTELVLTNVSLADGGAYQVDVTNSKGTVTSAAARLKVNFVPPEGQTLFFEDFNDLDFGPNVDEGLAGDAVWTAEPPEGWTVDNSGVPGVGNPDLDGVTEWAGWGFADRDWWVATAGDQNRSAFEKASGGIAIGDGDEWDDAAHEEGEITTFMTTPEIDIAGVAPGTLAIKFLSSWRPWDTQTGLITATFDTGDTVEVIRWESQEGDFFKSDDSANWNENAGAPIDAPAGAESMTLTFGYLTAGNDWWWAIDDIEVTGVQPLFAEDFESVELGPNVDEGLAGDEVWSKEGPDGWTINDEGVPGVGTDEDGVTEWAGWSFADLEWWNATAGDQQRSQFLTANGGLGSGTALIADPDEWDDAPHAASGQLPESGGAQSYDTFITSPEFSIAELEGEAVILTFDSSWRDEDRQTATITANFDTGDSLTVLRWESVGGANFKDDTPNEQVQIAIPVPTEAEAMSLTFALIDSGNDWWWAIDNIVVIDQGEGDIVIPPPPSPVVNDGATFGEFLGGNFFRLTATSEGATAYQWWTVGADGVPVAIEGETGDTLIATEGAVYAVTASNEGGSSEPTTFDLRVNPVLLGVVAFEEDFESVVLGPNVDEGVAGDMVWSAMPPEGWSVDNSQVPGVGDPDNDGVTEWAGWGFADAAWWMETAGDQQRTAFTKASGVAAIGDGDEWDDQAHADGEVTTFMTTPAIDLSAAPAGAAYLKFDSSWRPWDQQTGLITASFDGGDAVEVLRWESDSSSDFFKSDDSQHWNETVVVPLNNAAGASSVTLTFGYLNAGNDWWWAIDNIVVGYHPFFEGFEGLALGPNVDEGVAGDMVWTDVPPAGWMLDDLDTPAGGVTEWAGWGFADALWWIETAGDQQRSQFTKAIGTALIGDGDEWDDIGHDPGEVSTQLTTPEISLADFNAGEAHLVFDSSWRPWDQQTGLIEVAFDGGEFSEVLRWESDSSSDFFKSDFAYHWNESVVLPLDNPAGAQTATLRISYLTAGNDWWWALDNLAVTGVRLGETMVGAPMIGIAMEGGNVTVTWEGGALESAPSVMGPWTEVTGETSPALIPTTEAQAFYRVRP